MRDIWTSLGSAVAGAAIILALAYMFLTATIPHVQAASCVQMHASYYGKESGNRTADGEQFDGTSLTAAMPSRKHLGEHYRVTYKGKSVVVRINDVGPAKWTGRGIDLSRAAAQRIGLIQAGHGTVMACRV